MSFQDHIGLTEITGDGNLVRAADPNGISTAEATWERGILRSEIDTGGNQSIYTVDPFGRLAKLFGPSGGVTHLKYDLRGYLLELALPDGSRTRWEYDSDGNIVSVTDGNGHITRYVVGYCGRPLEIMDAAANVIR